MNNTDLGHGITLSDTDIPMGELDAITAGDWEEPTEPEQPESLFPRLWRATDLRPAAQARWLAKGRLPLASISLLVGDEGIGKSLLWVWIAAAVTAGKPLPEFGIPVNDPGHVIIVITEDEWAYTVRPRLEVAGADLNNVSVICTEDDGSGAPVFPRDLYLIREATPKPTLIVVDAWLDTVAPGLSVRDPQQARQALHPWKEIATAADAAVLLLTHTNRVQSTNARDRYGATAELRKKARMTLFAQADEDARLVVGPEKSNTAAPIPASVFAIEPVQVFPPTADSDGTVPLLVYSGESDRTAREHLADSIDPDDEPGGNPARAFILDYLTRDGGESAAGDVIKAGHTAGFKEDELKNARARSRKPRIASRKASFGDGWVWAIAAEDVSPDKAVQGVTEKAQGVQGVTQDGMTPNATPSTPSAPWGTPSTPDDVGTDCLVCGRGDADSTDMCSPCRTGYEAARRPPADVAAAIGKILAGVAKRPRFNSGTDRIRDTICDKTVREQSNIALDACLEHGWLRRERDGGRPGYTITDSGRKHLRRFADHIA